MRVAQRTGRFAESRLSADAESVFPKTGLPQKKLWRYTNAADSVSIG
jgi:hypothetical protein